LCRIRRKNYLKKLEMMRNTLVTKGLCSGRTNGYYGFTCVTCGKTHDRDDPPAVCEGISSLIKEVEEFDPVKKPSHYNQQGIECIQAIEASMTKEGFKGYLKGNCIKYLWRYSYKGKEKEDLEKAKWYLERLIERV
jgi:hypothetical protein